MTPTLRGGCSLQNIKVIEGIGMCILLWKQFIWNTLNLYLLWIDVIHLFNELFCFYLDLHCYFFLFYYLLKILLMLNSEWYLIWPWIDICIIHNYVTCLGPIIGISLSKNDLQKLKWLYLVIRESYLAGTHGFSDVRESLFGKDSRLFWFLSRL